MDEFCSRAATPLLLEESRVLDQFWRRSENLYQRVRAQLFLYTIYRFHLPYRPEISSRARIPFAASAHLLNRRYEEAIDVLGGAADNGLNAALANALSVAYRGLAFQTLANQVRRSVRSVRGNQWMSRIGHPDDYPLAIRPELLQKKSKDAPYPMLKESTPVRMDLTHSGWSDIFFLGMDYPEGARILNISIDLAVRGDENSAPRPPIEAYFRVIDEPVLRLTSVDLGATADIDTFAEVFDFARDYLGLLKSAVIAAGLVPPAMEGASQPLQRLLERLAGPGRGVELVSRVRNIPKGSRLAVSTNLLAGLISVCMRATNQISSLTGVPSENDRRLIAARAILGEWLGGSGGGWQDSGGVWPGIKIIEGVEAQEGDPEFGVSRGRLLPAHAMLSAADVPPDARQRLQDSLVLVHGGMAQDVGPILEMVTERYLLRSSEEWVAREEAIRIFDEIRRELTHGDVAAIGRATERNFFGPLQSIIPWASNLYTETLVAQTRSAMGSNFLGFWMLGGMAGGGMGFMFNPTAKELAQQQLHRLMLYTKKQIEDAVPFAMDPVVYDFAINERGTFAELLEESLLPASYYTLTVPPLVRTDPRLMSPTRRVELDRLSKASRQGGEYAGLVQAFFDRLLPSSEKDGAVPNSTLSELLVENGFDPVEHQQIRTDLAHGRIGLAQNRLPASSDIEDARPEDVFDARGEISAAFGRLGQQALQEGAVAVVSLAGGAGRRWTRGAGVVKALNPFCKFAGKYRNFIELQLAKSLRSSRLTGMPVPHVVTTSYLTHLPISTHMSRESNFGYPGPLWLSPGRSIGLRLVPTERDLRFAWEETAQQVLDEQKEKLKESLHAALIEWARKTGEASDYTDNLPLQCLHPTGHWYELPNMLRNGVLADMLQRRPQLRYLLLHNIDTVGVSLDAGLLGFHIDSKRALTVEVIARQFEDRGGGLARVDGRVRLVEGLALPSEELESKLSYYNTNTFWIEIDLLLSAFSLTRADLGDASRVATAIREMALRMPTYITLKEVKRRWGKGQEDVFPVAQFEKLFVDMTALPNVSSSFAVVSRQRGQQLKEPAQLDGWLRDGSADYVDSLGDWS